MQTAFDALLDDLARTCELEYPASKALCPNCTTGADGRSSNHYKAGGPTPFPANSICPVCLGSNVVGSATTENIQAAIAWSIAHWWVTPETWGHSKTEIPDGTIQTRFYLSDLPKVLRSRKMRVTGPIAAQRNLQYALWGEPLDSNNLVQGRYAVCNWTRA